MSIWDHDHPIWRILQLSLQLALAVVLLSHGVIDHVDVAHGGALDGTDALGAAWLLRELIGLKRT